MADFSSNVKQKFNLLLSQMSENRWLYVNHPQSDFTRQDTGKLTFSDTMRLIIGMGKSTTNDECVAYNKSTRYRRQNSPVSEREFLKIGKGHVEAK